GPGDLFRAARALSHLAQLKGRIEYVPTGQNLATDVECHGNVLVVFSEVTATVARKFQVTKFHIAGQAAGLVAPLIESNHHFAPGEEIKEFVITERTSRVTPHHRPKAAPEYFL